MAICKINYHLIYTGRKIFQTGTGRLIGVCLQGGETVAKGYAKLYNLYMT